MEHVSTSVVESCGCVCVSVPVTAMAGSLEEEAVSQSLRARPVLVSKLHTPFESFLVEVAPDT